MYGQFKIGGRFCRLLSFCSQHSTQGRVKCGAVGVCSRQDKGVVSVARGALGRSCGFHKHVMGVHISRTLVPSKAATSHRIIRRGNKIYITPLASSKRLVFMERFHCPCSRILLRLPTNGLRGNRSPFLTNGHRLGRRANTATHDCVSLKGLCPSPNCYKRVVRVCLTGKLAFNRRRLSGSRFLRIIGVPLRGTFRVIVGGRVASDGARIKVMGTCCLRGKGC